MDGWMMEDRAKRQKKAEWTEQETVVIFTVFEDVYSAAVSGEQTKR